MKNYLKDNLTDEEIAYIYGIIKKASLKFKKKYYKIMRNEENHFFYDDSYDKELLQTEENEEFNFINKILETKILRDITALKPYSQYEKEKIVKMLDNFACESGLDRFIAPLTFNEKLVVFLLYMENYQVNEVAILLNVSRIAIWKRDKSIKNKIQKIKEELSNGR